MEHLIIEIKARCANPDHAREALRRLGSRCIGLDHQIDTYFNCRHGRLKLREGNIERALIHYLRENQPGPKRSEVLLYQPQPGDELKAILECSLGILAIVDKRREIHFIENVKLHVDDVAGLGSFVEIEAIADPAHPGREGLLAQCRYFMGELGVREDDLLSCSYSDMILMNLKSQI